jgi:hypothetical protein
MFTKQHYHTIGLLLYNRLDLEKRRYEYKLVNNFTSPNKDAIFTVKNIAHDFARMFAEDNKKFDPQKFFNMVYKEE